MLLAKFTSNKFVNGFAVISYGTGWGCISENGEDSMKQCANATLPANATDIWNIESCG